MCVITASRCISGYDCNQPSTIHLESVAWLRQRCSIYLANVLFYLFHWFCHFSAEFPFRCNLNAYTFRICTNYLFVFSCLLLWFLLLHSLAARFEQDVQNFHEDIQNSIFSVSTKTANCVALTRDQWEILAIRSRLHSPALIAWTGNNRNWKSREKETDLMWWAWSMPKDVSVNWGEREFSWSQSRGKCEFRSISSLSCSAG